MRIGIPKEGRLGERLVAATPATVTQLQNLGYDVVVEFSAGAAANFPDDAYEDIGARVADAAEVWTCDVVAKVNAPTVDEIARLLPGNTVVSLMSPHNSPDLLTQLQARRVTGLALDAVPRISRAQSLDVLSSMSNVAGYRAVIEAAEEYGGMLMGQVTAAGRTNPATVFVIGAGVAGLAAIGAANSLGAQVRAFDVRPEVGEQIESMGAVFVQADVVQESSDGYARELTDEQQHLTMEMYARETANADIVITTALVRGQAVRTITADMVKAMRPGSVIVDLAATGGGNCELTQPGTQIVTDNGVTIIGYTDLTSRLPRHTSQLFGTNIVNLMKLLTPGKDGHLTYDFDDVIQRGICVTHDGELLWPPPPVQVSAAPTGPDAEETVKLEVKPAVSPEQLAHDQAELERRRSQRRLVSFGLGAVVLLLALSFTPAAFMADFTVFAMACFVGYYVISHVSHSLHTPLMAQTNAISGIILVGALLQLGSSNIVVVVLSFIAASVASINIFGGFLVAYRMLGMFRKGN